VFYLWNGAPVTKPYIGGQAVMEGVMMRSPGSFVVAVRRPEGTIAVREQPWTTLFPSLKFLRWPLFRGAVVLLESLHNGFSALKFSAEHALPEDGKGGKGAAVGSLLGSALAMPLLAADLEPPPPSNGKGKAELASTLMLVLATAVMVALFIAAPHLITFGIGTLVGPALDSGGVLFHVVDGFIRVGILVGYIYAISRTKDAKRLFQYHGAEHKAIWAYESGEPLTVAGARPFTTLHPRCGTSFLFVVVFVAVLLHIALLPMLPRLHPNQLVNQLLMVLVKVPLAFPIAGIAYELQRLSAKPHCPAFIRGLTRPGMWMQNITTQPPTDDQLEISVLALSRALAREEGRTQGDGGVLIYPDFARAQAA
jgi:uncharacterized protein YqhQ